MPEHRRVLERRHRDLMLMGAVCTRACRFCAVDTGNPRGWLDAEEPHNVAESVALMRLKYVVLTSVNRDDLPDGGAAHYAACIRAIKQRDAAHRGGGADAGFPGRAAPTSRPCSMPGPDVFAQNVETVRRLTHPVRDPRAGYEQTLAVLAHAKQHRPQVLTKTSLMLGLGESDAGDRRSACADLRARRGRHPHAGPVSAADGASSAGARRFVHARASSSATAPGGWRCGFRECVSGPLVRSSYRAEQALAGNNVGLSAHSECAAGQLALARASSRMLPPQVEWLGRVPYEPTWRAMQRFTEERGPDIAGPDLVARARARCSRSA